ncbi:hypothetical protein D9758_010572 [Tetrapyrgos nigripes]|uniref:GH16 domain-containing protein n=1 Tax=Tetrapyrgos nigripes TaxID=182062 RepID=A0A8H5FYG3_9AGAR|nr:hypothetical protein D9758_010572 [Tetrapyrgos nigripes]
MPSSSRFSSAMASSSSDGRFIENLHEPESHPSTGTAANPFSPPASMTSFGASTPSAPASVIDPEYDIPRSGVTSVSTSYADLPRLPGSAYTSRPNTADDSYPGVGTRQRINSSSSPRLFARESFQSPPSRPLTIHSSPVLPRPKRDKGRPKSTALASGTVIDKPWLEKHDPYSRYAYFVTYAVVLFGIAASAVKCYFDYQHVPMINGNLCPVLDENFDSEDGIFGDNGVFMREVDMSGFGNGEFEMTTESPNNSFVANGHLYLVPTLTSDSVPMSQILDGSVYNITGCTYNITNGFSYTSDSRNAPHSSAFGADSFDADAYYKACSAVSNATQGQIINPVQSARLNTRRTASIKYGKVEVRAKIPTGDWLWPAIWMLPVDSAYGSWPLSAPFLLKPKFFLRSTFPLRFIVREIDIMEARGNGPSYPKQGSDYVRGSLNWGPLTWLNAVSKTYGWWQLRRGSYDKDFHTYSLEWTEDFIRIYVDSRLHNMMDLRVKKGFWDRGDFPAVVQNGSDVIALQDPWVNGTKAAPFDQRFYLILNVAVGGTNGWFPDGPEKPWLDGSSSEYPVDHHHSYSWSWTLVPKYLLPLTSHVCRVGLSTELIINWPLAKISFTPGRRTYHVYVYLMPA